MWNPTEECDHMDLGVLEGKKMPLGDKCEEAKEECSFKTC